MLKRPFFSLNPLSMNREFSALHTYKETPFLPLTPGLQQLYQEYNLPFLAPTPPPPATPLVFTAHHLMSQEATEIPTLLSPVFPKQGLIALAGSSDTGKSALLRQFATAIACHEPDFLGFAIRATHHRAIYVSTEDDETSVRFLLHKQNEGNHFENEHFKNLKYIFEYENLLDNLHTQLTQEPADVVIIDAFADLFSGNLNQNNEVRKFLNPFKTLSDTHHCLIIFLHHTGKATDKKAPSKHNLIGSQGFEGKMRLVVELRKDPADDRLRHFCIVKGNYLPPEYKSASFALRFDEHMLFQNTGDRTPFDALAQPETPYDTEKLLQLVQEGKTQREIASQLGISVSTITRKVRLEGLTSQSYEKKGERNEEILKLHRQGKGIREIARLTGISKSTVSEVINQYKILQTLNQTGHPELDLSVSLSDNYTSVRFDSQTETQKVNQTGHLDSEVTSSLSDTYESDFKNSSGNSETMNQTGHLSALEIVSRVFEGYSARSRRMVINLMRCDYEIPEDEGATLLDQFLALGHLSVADMGCSTPDAFYKFNSPLFTTPNPSLK